MEDADLMQTLQLQKAEQDAASNPTPQNQALLQKLYQRQQQQELMRNKLLQEQLQARLQTAPTDIDWTPLAAQLKEWGGGGAALAGAESLNARNKAEQERTNALFDQLTKGNSQALSPKDLLATGLRDQRADKGMLNKAFSEVSKVFGKEYNAVTEANARFQTIERALATRDPERISQVLSQIARQNGEKGVLTDTDVGRQYVQTFDSKIRGFLTKFKKGQKVNPQDLVNLAGSVQDAKDIFQATSSERLAAMEDSYSGNPTYAKAIDQLKHGATGGVIGSAKAMVKPKAQNQPKAQQQAVTKPQSLDDL